MNSISSQSYYADGMLGVKSDARIRRKVVKDAVNEILSQARHYIKKPVNMLNVLDIGSGPGDYSIEISKYVKKVVGVEPFKKAYKFSVYSANKTGRKVKFYNKLIENFYPKEKFDLILCLTALEHMPKAEKSLKRALDVLEDDGFIYLTAPNRLWPYEHHYRLYFLSWLPLRLANCYVRAFKRGESFEDSSYSRTYFGMISLFRKLGCKYRFIAPSDSDSSYIGCGVNNKTYKLAKNLGLKLLKISPLFWIISKGFIVTLSKNPLKN